MTLAKLGYYYAQIRQAKAKYDKPPRLEHIDRAIRLSGLAAGAEVLCVGARNAQEPLAFRLRGYRALGVDLLPHLHPAMRWGDFHRLPFQDGRFALLYAAHAYEHTRDMTAAAREAIRVLKPSGFLYAVFPVHFVLSAHDLVDFGSPDGFLRWFPGFLRVWHRETPTEVAVLARLEATSS
mgnify:CR=1 FL=1